MDSHRRPPPREALSDERARELALAEVLRMEEAKRLDAGWDPPRQTTRRRAILTGVALVVAVLLWVVPPAPLALADASVPAPDSARVQASLHLLVGFQVERIEAFRARNGRLPDTLDQVGRVLGFEGVTYMRSDTLARAYRVSARASGQVVTFESTDSIEVVVRSALRTLQDSVAP